MVREEKNKHKERARAVTLPTRSTSVVLPDQTVYAVGKHLRASFLVRLMPLPL